MQKLDGGNTTLLNICSEVQTFTNISYIYTKYATLIISANCNLIDIHLEIISLKKDKRGVCGTTRKIQMPLPNKHFTKGRYPLYGQGPLSAISMYVLLATLANFMKTSPNNTLSIPWGR